MADYTYVYTEFGNTVEITGSSKSFAVVTQYAYTETSIDGWHLWRSQYVRVLTNDDGGTFTNYCRTSWYGEDKTFSLGVVGDHCAILEDLGWVEYGTVVDNNSYAYYEGSSGIQYKSELSCTFTVPYPTATITFYRNQTLTDTVTRTETYTLGMGGSFSDIKWTYTGYTLSGWTWTRGSFTVDQIGTSVTDNFIYWIWSSYAGKRDIYAVWVANTYKLSFNANGGTLSTASKNVTYNSAYGDLPEPTRNGYSFDGWYTAIDGGSRKTSTVIYSTANDSTLYAHWVAKTYNITLDANNGNSIYPVITVTYGDAYGENLENNIPLKAGYIFSGWYTSIDGGSKIMADTTVTTASNHTLYAHWEAANVAYLKKDDVYRLCLTYVKEDDEWQPAIMYKKIKGQYTRSII